MKAMERDVKKKIFRGVVAQPPMVANLILRCGVGSIDSSQYDGKSH